MTSNQTPATCLTDGHCVSPDDVNNICMRCGDKTTGLDPEIHGRFYREATTDTAWRDAAYKLGVALISESDRNWTPETWYSAMLNVCHDTQVNGWRTDMENAPPDTDLLLYCPYRAESNPERIECGVYKNTKGGSLHSWATHWRPLPAPPTPNEE